MGKSKAYLKVVDNAIKKRYDRFNRLWKEGTGHTFEEESEYQKNLQEKEMKEWQPKLDGVLKKYNFDTLDDYTKTLIWEERDLGYSCYINTNEEIESVLREKPNHHDALYAYEKFCINEAYKLTKWVIENKSIEWWSDNAVDKTIYELDNILKAEGFEYDDGHSGNSFGEMIIMANCLLVSPDMFQYMHGALSPLVGDKAYYDDRSDLPQETGVE